MIKITDKIKKEFLKSLVNKNCKIDYFDLNTTQINKINNDYFIIFKKNKKCKILKKIQEFLDIFNNNFKPKVMLLSENINSITINNPNYNQNKTIIDKAYNTLRKNWGYKIIELTKTNVCPYCNRNFISNFGNNNTTVELDHYFPKSSSPHLALNIYNLIPSCHTCNHKKRNRKLQHLHPFFDNLNKKIKFNIQLENVNFYNSINGFELGINNIYNENKIKNHINIFKLEDLYKNHKDIILELIQKKIIYNESYLNEILKNYQGKLFNNREDLLRLITCGYINEDELGKRPLSKLIKDISEQLDLL